ncbi:hypothetical protein [Streptomyces pseudogriseolus]|uniref:hypothetical protein n=1 Tax=Streptomyces pseudogriseolus TaxID=36817 RepID=UPI000345B967|nr:hypothetical protein [Streptomyces gancidicus]
MLAALPRRPASYAQQVGRAGRRTGNAFLLTIPDRRRRDLYFLERPKDLIAGTIVPPGSYLSAVEILRRQYLAHLLDLAAAGRLVRADGIVLRPLPHKAPRLFGPSGYLTDLVELALDQGEELVKKFLRLSPVGVSEQAGADLEAYATHGLHSAVERAEGEWRRAEDALRARLREIDEAHGELHDSDPDQARQKAELDAERRGVGRQLLHLGDTTAQTALCDLGLLPNYALIDSSTTLSATLYGEDGIDPKTGKVVYTSDPSSTSGPAASRSRSWRRATPSTSTATGTRSPAWSCRRAGARSGGPGGCAQGAGTYAPRTPPTIALRAPGAGRARSPTTAPACSRSWSRPP